MTLTKAQLRFIRDNGLFDVLEAALEQNFVQTDIDFALIIKKTQYLERIASKRFR
jgi:hypothetical protein